jgi:threonine synthase
MGLPVQQLVIATNSNDILARALDQGVYASGDAHPTLSPSMDIQVASNFERALFEACDRDSAWTAAAMRDFSRDRRLQLPQEVLAALRFRYSAFAEDDAATLDAIRTMHQETGRILDPHTAVGVAASRELEEAAAPVVVLATAHPAKFPEAVTRALGFPPPVPERLQGLSQLPERVETLPVSLPLIRDFISSRLGP